MCKIIWIIKGSTIIWYIVTRIVVFYQKAYNILRDFKLEMEKREKDMSNILDAIMNIINDGTFRATRSKDTENSVNIVGDSLEEYIKDAFANSFTLEGENRDEAMQQCIIYHGNSSNPPDMITGGDDGIVIEVKKSNSYRSELQLNSSMPHNTFNSQDTRITRECKELLGDKEWDMLYVVGSFVKKTKQIRHLAMVYGSVYCAETSKYERIDYYVRSKVKEIESWLIETVPTARLDTESNELGKLKSIDPKGFCDLRIRGMYTYDSPYVVFNQEFNSSEDIFDLFVVIPDDVFQSFNNKEGFLEFVNENTDISCEQVNYPDPNNIENVISCQKIIYIKKTE